MAETLSADDLAAALDERCTDTGERWELYRLSTGGWRAHAHDRHESPASDPAAVSATGATITEALAGLVAAPRLPVIPRQPMLVALTVVKVDGWFQVQDGGMFAGYRSRVKREAVAAAERGEVAARERHEEWTARWAAVVAAGVEGVDFYWKP
jgi:hypothetical protein